MSVRSKITLLLLVAFVLSLGGAEVVNTLVVMPSFYKLERGDASDDMTRVNEALNAELEKLMSVTRDWCLWDDPYKWIAGQNDSFAATNLIPEVEKFVTPGVNLIYFVDPKGRVFWGKVCVGQEVYKCPELEAALAGRGRALYQHKDAMSSVTGILMTSRGPMLLASGPLLPGDRKGDIRGAVIMGRYLTAAMVHAIGERTHMDLVEIWPLAGLSVPAKLQSQFKRVGKGGPFLIDLDRPDRLSSYGGVPTILGDPGLLIRIDAPRDIVAQGRRQTGIAFITDVVTGGSIMLLLWLVLNRLVVGPLTRLTQHARSVGKSGNLNSRLKLDRNDEIGTLANEFDRMVGSLAESRSQMMSTARDAGKAEVATFVLHNVGNILNSVNISADMIEAKVQASHVHNLVAVADLVGEHTADLGEFVTRDARGKLLPQVLKEIGTHLESEQNQLLEETKSLADNINHIKSIISVQQRHAKVAVSEMVSPNELVKDALQLTASGLDRHMIRVLEKLDPDVPEIKTDKHAVLQILANLITNAKQAMKGAAPNEKTLTLRTTGNNRDGVCFEITDSGVGIESEKLTQIFMFGFTTKEDGHGFGLHTSMLSARQLGGDLSVHSEGPGKGATFTLKLPVTQPSDLVHVAGETR